MMRPTDVPFNPLLPHHIPSVVLSNAFHSFPEFVQPKYVTVAPSQMFGTRNPLSGKSTVGDIEGVFVGLVLGDNDGFFVGDNWCNQS